MTPQQQQLPTGIPQWLEQFLNSQGGMQGLLYQVGGIRGLLDLIQQQSQQQEQQLQQQSQPPPPPRAEPWRDLLQAHQPPPPPAWQRPSTQPTTAPLPPLPATGPYRPTNSPLYRAIPEKTPAGTPLWGTNNVSSTTGSIPLTEAEMQQFMNTTGLKGQDYFNALPAPLRPTGVTPDIINSYNTADAALRAAMQAGNVTPELSQASANATYALNAAQYGPLGNPFGVDGPMWLPQNKLGGGGVYTPHAPKPGWSPRTKYDLAAQYGYADRSPMGAHNQTGLADQNIDAANILQTLKMMGWESGGAKTAYDQTIPSINPGTGKPYTAAQAQMFKDLQASIAPKSSPANLRAKYATPPSLPAAPDPFAGMQSAINRDAYVNETLGGGFYGGIIPERDAINTFGDRNIGGAHDPHFPTPQLALNPLPGQSKYDTYAGWAADQGAAFGTAPWAVDSMWGRAQGYNDPKLYQQPPPPPTAWQPTPQFGGQNNAWSGTMGWGNTSRNQGSNQMTFGNSPWGNPWGMP